MERCFTTPFTGKDVYAQVQVYNTRPAGYGRYGFSLRVDFNGSSKLFDYETNDMPWKDSLDEMDSSERDKAIIEKFMTEFNEASIGQWIEDVIEADAEMENDNNF